MAIGNPFVNLSKCINGLSVILLGFMLVACGIELDNPDNKLDVDGDGYSDNVDNCVQVANGVNEDDQSDIDGDGLGDACDGEAFPEAGDDLANDSDNDGFNELEDNCPSVANPLQEAVIGNSTISGDACDDEDADGKADAFDNCPEVANDNQADNFGSDAGDACEDTDGDNTLDIIDTCPPVANENQDDRSGCACNFVEIEYSLDRTIYNINPDLYFGGGFGDFILGGDPGSFIWVTYQDDGTGNPLPYGEVFISEIFQYIDFVMNVVGVTITNNLISESTIDTRWNGSDNASTYRDSLTAVSSRGFLDASGTVATMNGLEGLRTTGSVSCSGGSSCNFVDQQPRNTNYPKLLLNSLMLNGTEIESNTFDIPDPDATVTLQYRGVATGNKRFITDSDGVCW